MSHTSVVEPDSYALIYFVHDHDGDSKEHVRHGFEDDVELTGTHSLVNQVVQSEEIEADENDKAVTDDHHWQADSVEEKIALPFRVVRFQPPSDETRPQRTLKKTVSCDNVADENRH